MRRGRSAAGGGEPALFPSIVEARAWLDGHVNLEATAGDTYGLSLAPMRELLAALGDPQTDYPAIHVTGTNGKGSVAALAAALAWAWGMTVGVYSSPHVEHINERMAVSGESIGDDDLAELLGHLRLVTDHLATGRLDAPPSWFELVTSAALRWFADVAVDLAVVEVGKLGRYDATNVVNSEVAIITNIGRDHTDGRPGWEAEVMGEKAGIIHPGATAVLGPMDPELAAIAARESPRELLVAGEHFALEEDRPAMGGRVVTVRTPRGRYEDVYVSLFGAHQGQNAALAIAAFEALVGQELDGPVLDALGDVSVPARFEVVSRRPLVVIDGAHNPDGLAASATTLNDQFDVTGTVIWVIGIMRDKSPDAILEAIEAAGTRPEVVICCAPAWPRALEAQDLATAVRNRGIETEVAGDVADAVDRALDRATPDDAVMVTGSFYTAGAARLHVAGPTG